MKFGFFFTCATFALISSAVPQTCIYHWNVDNVGYYLANIGFAGVHLVYDISGMTI